MLRAARLAPLSPRVRATAPLAASRAPPRAGGRALFNRVNWEDPHFNIDLLLFCIHGNHDDPVRESAGASEELLSALDLLAAANLINYFGRSESAERVDLHPVLLAKGRTRLALYGLGYTPDYVVYHELVMTTKEYMQVGPRTAAAAREGGGEGAAAASSGRGAAPAHRPRRARGRY